MLRVGGTWYDVWGVWHISLAGGSMTWLFLVGWETQMRRSEADTAFLGL